MFKIIQILYLDDGAFIFELQSDLIKDVTLLNSLLKNKTKTKTKTETKIKIKQKAKKGMEMYMGRKRKASKTECIMLLPPGFLT